MTILGTTYDGSNTGLSAEALTIAQASEESGIPKQKLRNDVRKGALRVVCIGPTKRLRIAREEFERYVKK